MTIRTAILIILTVTFSFAYGQKLKVKKETEIVMTFDYNYLKDGELYLSKKPSITIDTTITEFNEDGSLKYPDSSLTSVKISYCDSIVFISKISNIKHEREYWSNSKPINIYTQNFGDSIIQVKIYEEDTVQINKSYFQNGKLVKCYNQDMRSSYGKFSEIIIYDRKNKNREIATVISNHLENGTTDTVKIDNNNRRKVYKTFVYNPDKKEWFTQEKTKTGKSKSVIWETFYHSYHKMYFTTKTSITNNDYGLTETEIVYDSYLKHIEKKTIYMYEFY